MPLHDWADLPGWDGVRQVWTVELLYAVKPLLPPAYRATIGTTPTFAIGAPAAGRAWASETGRPAKRPQPRRRPAVESSRMRRSPSPHSRRTRRSRWGRPARGGGGTRVAAEQGPARRPGRVRRGVRRVPPAGRAPAPRGRAPPAGVSFADRVAEGLGLPPPGLAAPFAAGYRVGGPAPSGGRFLAAWRRPLAVGGPLPAMPLFLSADESVPVDRDGTYRRATKAAYLG